MPTGSPARPADPAGAAVLGGGAVGGLHGAADDEARRGDVGANRVVGPDLGEAFEDLFHDGAAGAHVGADRGVVVGATAEPQTEREAPAGERVEAQGLL